MGSLLISTIFHAIEPFEGKTKLEALSEEYDPNKNYPFIFVNIPNKEGVARYYEDNELKEVIVEEVWSGCNHYKFNKDKVYIAHTHPDAPYLWRRERKLEEFRPKEHHKDFLNSDIDFSEYTARNPDHWFEYMIEVGGNEDKIFVPLSLFILQEPLVIDTDFPLYEFVLRSYLESQKILRQTGKPQSVITMLQDNEIETLAEEFSGDY